MYKSLINKQRKGDITENVKIYGFINNMNDFLEKAHIILTKAGPNMILEAARSATAVVITGYILGQENKNYEYIVKNHFGFKCTNPKRIYNKLNDFIKSSELNECLKNVLNSDCNNGAEFIINYIKNNIKY